MDYLSTVCTGFMPLNFGRSFILKQVQKYMQGYRENKVSGKEKRSER